MKALQLYDDKGGRVCSLEINPIQERIITSVMVSLQFRAIKNEENEGRAWRALEAISRARAQEIEAQERRELQEELLREGRFNPALD